MDDFLIVKKFVEELILYKKNIGGLRILTLQTNDNDHVAAVIVYNDKILYELEADELEDGRIAVSYSSNTVPEENIPDMISSTNIVKTVEVISVVLVESRTKMLGS